MSPTTINTTIEADVMTPGKLWASCKGLSGSDFPAQVTMGDGEAVFLDNSREARLFGLGVHFGGMAEHSHAHA